MKTFAVIIATAHTPEYIIDCVNSVLMQSVTGEWGFEIRIGVDGCPKTSEILTRHNIRHWYSSKNVGAYVMRNSLIYLNQADVYGYFDADDTMKPDYISRTIKAIEGGLEAVMLAKEEVNENLKSLYRPPIVQDGGAISFTHEVLKKVGGFQPFRCAGDTDLMRRIESAGFYIYTIDDKAYYLRRRHLKSLTRSGLTVYGGYYRKEAWETMCLDREKGVIKVNPEITNLELIL